VAFDSAASTLVAGDTYGTWTCLSATVRPAPRAGQCAHERYAGEQHQRVSVDQRRRPLHRFRILREQSRVGDTNALLDVFVRDLISDTTQLASISSTGVQGSGDSYDASVSADGRYVGFVSEADNLALGDTNGDRDIFVRDQTAGATTRASTATDGAQANDASLYPQVSANGSAWSSRRMRPISCPGIPTAHGTSSPYP